jgi:hypothetical protein
MAGEKIVKPVIEGVCKTVGLDATYTIGALVGGALALFLAETTVRFGPSLLFCLTSPYQRYISWCPRTPTIVVAVLLFEISVGAFLGTTVVAYGADYLEELERRYTDRPQLVDRLIVLIIAGIVISCVLLPIVDTIMFGS